MIKKILKTCWKWGKRHTFHFITTLFLLSVAFIIVVQQIRINSLQTQISNIPSLITSSEDTTKVLIDGVEENLFAQVEASNARIDTIDSAIKPEKKRRMLITKIRDAINENTNRTVGIRDLNKIANAVVDYSYEFDLTIPQVLAQIKIESDFNPNAVSLANAKGLMQILPTTLVYIEHEMPDSPVKLNTWNIYHNIRAGCFYMSEQIERFGTYENALRAYNWGPDNLARFNAGEIKNEPEETLKYVPKVKEYVEIFSKYGLE